MSEQKLNKKRVGTHYASHHILLAKIKFKNYAKQENKDKQLDWNFSYTADYLYKQPNYTDNHIPLRKRMDNLQPQPNCFPNSFLFPNQNKIHGSQLTLIP